jgi:hypothetical protein
MSSLLFEQLDNSGFLRSGAVNVERIRRASVADLVDAASESIALTSAAEIGRSTSPYEHTASMSLGGGPNPCSAIDCRIGHSDQLAQFASLYSDSVYVHNLLGDHAHHTDRYTKDSLPEFRQKVVDDLTVLNRMRPLVEAGRIVPVTAPLATCSGCGSAMIALLDTEVERRFKRARRSVFSRYAAELVIDFELRGGRVGAHMRGPEDLLEHGERYFLFSDTSKIFSEIPRLKKSLAEGGAPTRLTKREAARAGLNAGQALVVLRDLRFELAVGQSLGTSLLTDRPISFDLVNRIAGTDAVRRRNEVIREHLTTIVPFLDGVPPQELLRLRQTDGDSFVLFRHALNEAVDEACASKSTFSSADAKALYGDVIAPRLARLGVTVRAARRTLVKDAGRKTAGWVGAIAFGQLTGLLPASLAVTAKALGLTKVIADLTADTLKPVDKTSPIRADSMFFLWQVKQLSKK